MNSKGAGRRLERARVLIVGVGGLGSPAALHLAAAGVRTLVLIDPDAVELSNLNRQILHRTSAIGQAKVASARIRLAALHPQTGVETHPERLTIDNAEPLFREADFIIDGTDSIETKYLINDLAVSLGRPYSHAGVVGLTGQTMTVVPHQTACLRCLFPERPAAGAVPTCQDAGILGAVAGLIGSIQAAEAVKYLLGRGDLLANRLLTFDAFSGRWRTVRLERSPHCPACGNSCRLDTTRLGEAEL